tara:strand:- start:104 stop:406 length:303 start_codon:yes stop_codon:yes gene_type:complete
MLVTHTWSISDLERQVEGDGVIVVHWRLNSTDGSNSTSAYGTTNHTPDPDDEDFVPFNDLIEEDVLNWVWSQVYKKGTETRNKDKIELLSNPVVLSGLPW